jgi:hypothetical protein
VFKILSLSFIFLVFAHLAVKEYFPNPAIWLIGAMIILAAGVVSLHAWKDDFAFLLVIFVCAHFNFADNQGGLWSYVLCSVFLAAGLLGYRPTFRFSSIPWSSNLLLLALLLHQFLGLVFNPYSLVSNIQATVITVAQVLAFYYCASQKINEMTLKRLIMVWFIIVCWIFVMALNQKYHWVITTSPLLPQRFRDTAGYIAAIPAGSFGNSELFGEYFCIVFITALVIVSHMKELTVLRLKKAFIFFIMLISVAAVMMSGSRAALMLAVAAAGYLTISTFILAPSARSLKRIFAALFALIFSGMLMWQAGSLFSLDEMMSDMAELNLKKINSESIISGKGINRSFTIAYKLWEKESWLIGKGYNLPENNTTSLGLPKGASDYHSLYVCLPFFYGWGGAAAFVLLVIATGLRIFLSYFKKRGNSNPFVPIALGFSVIWGVFLLDQYKISVTRNPSYFLLIWMLMGWTHSLANSMRGIDDKRQNMNNRLPVKSL